LEILRLRVRYTTGKDGKARKHAVIYEAHEHGIQPQLIDEDAVKIVRRLQQHGHPAYIVGGAVRDLLVGEAPKDFDIVTDAQPNRIRKLFRNSRIIGKRFRLVHIFFGSKIIEVSTFRSAEAEGFNNVYGNIEEDALRRDFGVNALYYCPLEQEILDFVHGFKDFRAKRIRPIIPVERIFREDPVRMLRAVKYSASTGFRVVLPLRLRMRKQAKLLSDCPASRLSEEVFKILVSGRSHSVMHACRQYHLLEHMLPSFAETLLHGGAFAEQKFFALLEELDAQVASERGADRALALAFLCADYLFRSGPYVEHTTIPFKDAYQSLKDQLKPVTPANIEVEKALQHLLRRRKRYLSEGPGALRLKTDSIDARTRKAKTAPGPTKQIRDDAPRPSSEGEAASVAEDAHTQSTTRTASSRRRRRRGRQKKTEQRE
jgi:poly(A) polymerase